MLTTVRIRARFDPARTVTMAAGSTVDFWDLTPQIGRPRTTRYPTSNITRSFDRLARISHAGDVGDRKDWRPYGPEFIRIVGGTDDKLWVNVNKPGITANITRDECDAPADCSAEYDQGVADGIASAKAEWEAWAAGAPVSGGGGSGEGEPMGDAATVIPVPDTASSVQLLPASPVRVAFRIFNNSTATLYVKFGTPASTTSFTTKVPSGAYLVENNYSGRVDGIWSADASGDAQITEIS